MTNKLIFSAIISVSLLVLITFMMPVKTKPSNIVLDNTIHYSFDDYADNPSKVENELGMPITYPTKLLITDPETGEEVFELHKPNQIPYTMFPIMIYDN